MVSGNGKCPSMKLRPYQVLCLVCSLGGSESGPSNEKLKRLMAAIWENPDMPVTLVCNAGDVYVYQDPGTAEDTPEGADFNRKRDLDILQRLDLVPGSALPARTLFRLVLQQVPSVAGICGYDAVTAAAWKGCPKAQSGNYERGRKKGIVAIVPPRPEAEMALDKERSLRDMYADKTVAIRPHILLCALAQYGGGVRPPFKDDNLPEFIQHILKQPDTLVTLAPGADWMMCGPCPSRVANLNACVCGRIGSGGLYNEAKDLNTLQVLGLTYGSTMPARELYRLIFERIPSVAGVCALAGVHPETSVWRDGCGAKADPCPNYGKGREMLRNELLASASRPPL